MSHVSESSKSYVGNHVSLGGWMQYGRICCHFQAKERNFFFSEPATHWDSSQTQFSHRGLAYLKERITFLQSCPWLVKLGSWCIVQHLGLSHPTVNILDKSPSPRKWFGRTRANSPKHAGQACSKNSFISPRIVFYVQLGFLTHKRFPAHQQPTCSDLSEIKLLSVSTQMPMHNLAAYFPAHTSWNKNVEKDENGGTALGWIETCRFLFFTTNRSFSWPSVTKMWQIQTLDKTKSPERTKATKLWAGEKISVKSTDILQWTTDFSRIIFNSPSVLPQRPYASKRGAKFHHEYA